ncbi:MAG: Ig domain-containing protein, partial [Clostridium sp.]
MFDLKGNFVDVPVTSIALDKTRLTLQTGEMASLQATIAPKLAKDTELVWSSSDPTVAAFSKEDPIRIRALRPGTVTITVTAGAVSASCEVTVNKVTAVVPPFDTSKPTDTVEAGLNDEAVTNTIN